MSFATRNIPLNITKNRGNGLTERVVQRLLTDAPKLAAGAGGEKDTLSSTARRRKVWELDRSLHCSIIGTCLSFAELRSLGRRIGLPEPSPEQTEHELHGLVVGSAGKADTGGRVIHKVLDRKFATAVAQFDHAATAEAVRKLWREARERGEVPGAYWAAMTHPATTPETLRGIFGEVHMLSHLMGAANRADIHRLQALEHERRLLQEELAALQHQQREQMETNEARGRELLARIAELESARAAAAERVVAGADEDRGTLERTVKELRERLERQAGRMAHLERRAAGFEQAAAAAQSEVEKWQDEMNRLREENRQLDHVLAACLAEGEADEGAAPARDLSRRCVLYVGGRGQQIPHFRALVEQWNGRFLHHDGGLQDGSDSLAGSLARADAVLFPVDCISHKGYLKLKQLCRRQGTLYLPMRTSSLAAFARALGEVAAGRRGRTEIGEVAAE
jgi:hypothetical protein